MQRIKKGDRVRVIAGKFKNQEGNVIAVTPKTNQATIEGLNKVKLHKKPSQTNEKGGIFEEERPLQMSKLALIDPQSKGASVSKIGYRTEKDGRKVRFAKKSQVSLGERK